MDDWNLLQQYARQRSKEALDELVRRHLPMVHAAAMRQVRDPHLAEDVTQTVFLVLMRRAKNIPQRVVLAGWLFNVTRFASAKARRELGRRQRHEKKAATMKPIIIEAEDAGDAQELSALLDDAISGLSRGDRDAVVLKYLQGKSHEEIARIQRVSENTARQRLFRALGKLRGKLRRKGVSVSDQTLGASLVLAGSHSPPLDLTARLLSTLRGSTASGVSSMAANWASRIILMTKLKTMALAGLALLLLCITGGMVIHFAGGGGDATTPAPTGPPGAMVATTTPPSSTPSTGVTPNQLLTSVLYAALDGDAETMIAGFDHLNPPQEKSARQIAGGLAIAKDIGAAAAARFGQAQAQNLVRTLGFLPPTNGAIIDLISPSYKGDTAELDIPRLCVIKFVKVAGAWKLSPEVLTENQNTIDTFAAINSAAPDFRKIIAEINAGQYQNVSDARTQLQQIVTRIRDKDPAGELPDRPPVLAPGASPGETIAAFDWAQLTGDAAAAVACLDNPTPDQQEAIRVSTQLFAAGESIRAAIAGKFGLKIARNSILTLGLDPGLRKSMLQSVVDKSTGGERVQVDLSNIGLKLNLEKSSGVWRINPDFIGSRETRWRARLVEHFLPMYVQLAADINAGTCNNVRDLQTAVDALHQELKDDHEQFAAPVTQQ